jgi:trypsin-like peptidase
MADQTALDYADVTKRDLPHLYQCIVAIAHKGDDDEESIGSGVYVNINGRHLIATARHCIERAPRIINDRFILLVNKDGRNAGFLTDRPMQIVNAGWHARLDVGFLEITEPPAVEVAEGQLCLTRQAAGAVFVIGHPTCRLERIKERREITLYRCSFGTTIVETTEEYFKLDYPVMGVRPEEGEWRTGERLLDVPGFSGGGCFGISRTMRSGLEVIEYNLIGIQYSWHKGERWVKVVPIKHWFDVVQRAL